MADDHELMFQPLERRGKKVEREQKEEDPRGKKRKKGQRNRLIGLCSCGLYVCDRGKIREGWRGCGAGICSLMGVVVGGGGLVGLICLCICRSNKKCAENKKGKLPSHTPSSFPSSNWSNHHPSPFPFLSFDHSALLFLLLAAAKFLFVWLMLS